MYCGKTAEWIQIPFGVLSAAGVGQVGCIRWGGDRRRERDSFRVNFGRPTVTNGTATRSSQITSGRTSRISTNFGE